MSKYFHLISHNIKNIVKLNWNKLLKLKIYICLFAYMLAIAGQTAGPKSIKKNYNICF